MILLINKLFKLKWFPLLFQILSFIILLLIIVIGLQANTTNMSFAKILRNTNIANLIVWSYWWPLVILTSIFFGRFWCTICPMELVSSLAAKIGLKKRPSKFIKSGWIITILYITTLFVGVHILAIHRVPFRMGIYMIILIATVVVTAFIFAKNTFCAHICPVGHILALYARLAPVGWGVKEKAVCKSCDDKSCISNNLSYKLQGRSCGVGLYPAAIENNTDCLLCGQCLKACDQNKKELNVRPNAGLIKRKWAKDLLELHPFSAAQAFFAMVVSGFVIYELLTEWNVSKEILMWAPTYIDHVIGIKGGLFHSLLKSLLLFITLPLIIWLLPFTLFRISGGKLLTKDYFLRFGISFIPIMAAAHATKALLKTTSRIPYWHFSIFDPIGIDSATGIINKTATLTALPVWRDTFITVFSLSIMVAGMVLSSIIVKKLISKYITGPTWQSVLFYLIPGLYGGIFFVTFFVWRLMQ